MSPADPLPADAVPAALAAFLRGVERRGAVFAELQAGDLGQGERALAATIRAFRNHAARLPMADWPLRFWSLLSATPQLREAAAGAAWPPALAHLGELPADARAALLLRLAAGLDEGPAAQARGVDIAHYRDALARACPRDADGEADAAAWRQLAEVVQQRLRDLSPEELARLARLREAAMAGQATPARQAPPSAVMQPSRSDPRDPVEVAITAEDRARRRARWPWVVVVLLLCGAGLASVQWWPELQQAWSRWTGAGVAPVEVAEGAAPLDDAPPVEVASLDPAEPPALGMDANTALLLDRDFDLLADPESLDIVHEADLWAWYAAGAQPPPTAPADLQQDAASTQADADPALPPPPQYLPETTDAE